jgi:uncharacterized iron-regulated protein
MNTQDSSRKILEDLNFKKQQLQKGLPIIQTTPNQTPLLESQQINTAARATYQQAQSSSFGFFILTDSSFGNSILPVLPRFE